MDFINIILYSLLGVVIVSLVICLAIANFAGENLIVVYNKYSQQIVDFNNTINFAQNVSDNEFNGRIETRIISGFLTDNYYRGTISLSEPVAYASNVAAFAVCAHELGHAIQYRDTPKKMKKFSSRLLICNIFSKLTLPFFIIFIFINIYASIGFMGVSLLAFIIGLFAKLSTIKIEKEASQNAIELLKKYAYFDEESVKSAKKVLSAAKLTYIASFLKSVLAWTFLVKKYDFY